jgi:hypothetical protein
MPKLKFVVACEKTIFDQSGPVSLINIFQKMKIQLHAGIPLPERAISPNQWSVFCLWENEPQEVGLEFTQIVRVYAPDNTLFMEHEGTFRNNDVEEYQTKINLLLTSIPIWVEGMAAVRVSLKGSDVELGSYQFGIQYLPPAVVAASVEV